VNKQNQQNDISNKDLYFTLSVASLITALIYAFFIHDLAPSASYFDGAGRVLVILICNGSIIWIGYKIFRPWQSMSIGEVLAGSMLASFFGTMLGLFLAVILDYLGGL
jgi:hypothetical protein